jgi:preprotein translocase subunit SecB
VILDGFPDDRIERLVRTNGTSMLFGLLREVIRDTTARGPYTGVILPSTSFYQSEKESDPGATPAAQTSEAPAPAPKP